MRPILLAPALACCLGFGWKHEDAPPAENRPDWLSGTSAAYPRADYLLGVGEGSSREKAADRARAEVAKALSLTVDARTDIVAQESGGAAAVRSTEQISDDVRTAATKLMDGLELAQYWQDSKGTIYALAVLNRARARATVKDKLGEVDGEFKDLSANLAKTEGKFSRLRFALKLVQLAKSRKTLNSDYRALSSDGKGIAAPDGLNDAVSAARKAVAALRVQVAVTGDGADSVATRVIDDLGTLGLKAGEKEDKDPDILAELKTSGAVLPPENLMWYWAKGEASVKLSYGPAAEVFARFDETAEDSTRSPDTALSAAMTALSDKAAIRIYRAVLSAQLSDD